MVSQFLSQNRKKESGQFDSYLTDPYNIACMLLYDCFLLLATPPFVSGKRSNFGVLWSLPVPIVDKSHFSIGFAFCAKMEEFFTKCQYN